MLPVVGGLLVSCLVVAGLVAFGAWLSLDVRELRERFHRAQREGERARSEVVLLPEDHATRVGDLEVPETFQIGARSEELPTLSQVATASGPDVVELLSELSVSFTPTPEGLHARTAELWSQEGFLALTGAEVERLIGTDPSWALTVPTDLREFLGSDLPTLEDCRRALLDPESLRLLEVLCLAEALSSELVEVPVARRSADHDRVLAAARARRDAAEVDLLRRLDRASGYPNWSLLSRLYREWER